MNHLRGQTLHPSTQASGLGSLEAESEMETWVAMLIRDQFWRTEREEAGKSEAAQEANQASARPAGP